MTSDRLTQVARAYRDARAKEDAAKKALARAREQRSAAAEQVGKARVPLVEAIVQAARTGVRQRDILARIENVYTRENVRKICRDAGIEPTE